MYYLGRPCGCPAAVWLQLLQVASHFRRAGYFVVAALARPFAFEGRRRLEEAEAVVEALGEIAQLLVGQEGREAG